jgi:hypothetical protein
MAKRKRSAHPNDAIRNLQEWQDHQYDPGYRANLGRLGLFSGNRHGRPVGRFIVYGLVAEGVLMLLMTFLGSVGVGGPWLGIGFICALVAVFICIVSRLARAPGRPRRQRRGRR